MSLSRHSAAILRTAALAALIVGVLLGLASWDGLYDAFDLPKASPALSAQVGGAALVALAYLLWAASARPELAGPTALAGAIAEGGGGLVIAAWLIFRDRIDLGGIDTLGIVLLAATATVLVALALAQAWLAVALRGAPVERSGREP